MMYFNYHIFIYLFFVVNFYGNVMSTTSWFSKKEPFIPSIKNVGVVTLVTGMLERTSSANKCIGAVTLIKDNGYFIVVDSPSATDMISKEKMLKTLALQKISPTEIQMAITTHGHPDHFGQGLLFSNARHFFASYEYTDNTYITTDLSTNDSMKLTHHVEIWNTPGHTNQDVSIIVRTSCCGTIAVVGDLFYDENDANGDIKNWINEAWNPKLGMINRRKVICNANRIVPGHGPMFKVTDNMKKLYNCSKCIKCAAINVRCKVCKPIMEKVLITTKSITTTTDTPTTLFIPTTTTEIPTTIFTSTTTEFPTTMSTSTTTEIPTTMSTSTTTEIPTTMSTSTTTEFLTTSSTSTTTEIPTTIFTSTTTDFPTTISTSTKTEIPTTISTTTATTESPTIMTNILTKITTKSLTNTENKISDINQINSMITTSTTIPLCFNGPQLQYYIFTHPCLPCPTCPIYYPTKNDKAEFNFDEFVLKYNPISKVKNINNEEKINNNLSKLNYQNINNYINSNQKLVQQPIIYPETKSYSILRPFSKISPYFVDDNKKESTTILPITINSNQLPSPFKNVASNFMNYFRSHITKEKSMEDTAKSIVNDALKVIKVNQLDNMLSQQISLFPGVNKIKTNEEKF
ncbi:Beta-lactamase-like domain-containing protein [Strongyloides ratti]|uniref:Beta-lactamase-like domain-containing protein n=1 Tax=Strongyloides ratti TaxID=34506 RepID=A0A090MTW7_STRRB|nr:Beta-lactamase-like domain-containing protein [Strongyloides ratti]CEF61818.1 Beta-lactamase-like domain-containing protein [Strongyloides ratti]